MSLIKAVKFNANTVVKTSSASSDLITMVTSFKDMIKSRNGTAVPVHKTRDKKPKCSFLFHCFSFCPSLYTHLRFHCVSKYKESFKKINALRRLHV